MYLVHNQIYDLFQLRFTDLLDIEIKHDIEENHSSVRAIGFYGADLRWMALASNVAI